MSRSAGFQHTLPALLPKRTPKKLTGPAELRTWEAPTFAEFVWQIEHEFGNTVDVSSLDFARLDRDEPLTPVAIRSLCDLLGVPPEDLGV